MLTRLKAAITIPWTVTYSVLSPAKLAIIIAVGEGQESIEPIGQRASKRERTTTLNF
jgi:hypothetical protein